jgi:Zn-dependent peptidase ImmA (M78 family)
MKRADYYEEMRALARATRKKYGLATFRVQRSHLRAIYRDHGIRIDLWPHRPRAIRGAYFNDELGPTVMLVKGMPEDPTIFTMAHELKHHLVDRDLPVACCSERNVDQHIEIGAEVFAAELIFPDSDFLKLLAERGVTKGRCSAEALVRLKHDTRTTLSYAGLSKRAAFHGLAPAGSLDRVQWRKLEEHIYGEPVYKRILRRRAR